MSLALFFGISVFISGIFIRIGMLMSGHFGVMDHPGGHKQHNTSTSFVGGVGVMAVLLATLLVGELYFPDISLLPFQFILPGAAILFLTGLADDVWHLSFKIRFVIQALVALSMAYFGGVELTSLGELLPGLAAIDLGPLAMSFTVFAAIGLINALNMIDGIDGLSGSLSFISLGFAALLACMVGNNTYLVFIVAIMGGVAGFLYFNLRYPSNDRARVFLGDNGSMLLGFVFAWLFIGLSQGEYPAMTPVTALWLFAVPLIDTVSVMLRRIWMGKSPFHADRNHLHHLFMRAGFRVSDTVWIISLIQLALGFIGIAGLVMNLPHYLMFGLFLSVFAGYFHVIVRPWHFVPMLRRINVVLGLPSVHARGIFIGYFAKTASREMLEILAEEASDLDDYRLSLQQVDHKIRGNADIYAVIEVGGIEDEASMGQIRRSMAQIKARLAEKSGVHVRLFMHRNSENDRRVNEGPRERTQNNECSRGRDRRAGGEKVVIYSIGTQQDKAVPITVRV